ncbi:MAG: NAD(+)/NADH kinase [Myxococcota bacterium]
MRSHEAKQDEPRSLRTVALVVKKSEISILRARRVSKATSARLLLAHEEHLASLRTVRQELRWRGIRFTEHPVGEAPARADLVLTVGGDGTLIEASHFVSGATPVLGVNSAPSSSVGFLTGCRAPTFAETLDGLIAGWIQPRKVARLAVRIGKRQLPEPVLNDVLFCHENPAQTTRYHLFVPGAEEEQRSSGLWISTPAGSTAALRSAGGEPLPLEAQRFAFRIREPYAPPGSVVRIEGGVLDRGSSLKLRCLLAPGYVYIDGAHRRYPVPFDALLEIRLSRRPLALVRPDAAAGRRSHVSAR